MRLLVAATTTAAVSQRLLLAKERLPYSCSIWLVSCYTNLALLSARQQIIWAMGWAIRAQFSGEKLMPVPFLTLKVWILQLRLSLS